MASSCIECPNEANHKYMVIRKNAGLSTLPSGIKIKIHNAFKSESQCGLSITKSIDTPKTEAIIECCSNLPQKAADFANENLDYYKKFANRKEAANYMIANIEKYQEPEEE